MCQHGNKRLSAALPLCAERMFCSVSPPLPACLPACASRQRVTRRARCSSRCRYKSRCRVPHRTAHLGPPPRPAPPNPAPPHPAPRHLQASLRRGGEIFLMSMIRHLSPRVTHARAPCRAVPCPAGRAHARPISTMCLELSRRSPDLFGSFFSRPRLADSVLIGTNAAAMTASASFVAKKNKNKTKNK